MIKISKQNNSLIVEGIDNVFYINNGDNSYPLNSLIVVTDNSDMATFRSVATNDVLFSGLIKDITINGESVTKDNIIAKFDAVSNSSTGGGGGGTVDAYTKEEADNKFASKAELTNVQTVANDADTKVDALTPRVEGVETTMGNKQDTLVSGTNIKTINNQSILGEGNIEITGGDVDLTDYYTKTEADGKFATVTGFNEQAADISALQTDMRGKQATLVSGENIKTINSESILGNGDIQINGVSDEQAQEIAKIPTLETELAQKANASDVATQQEVNVIAANVSALESDMANKQPILVSGTNIKTINNESLLGEGNIEVAKKTDIPNTDNFATKNELTAVETVANNAATKADAATNRVESVETALGNKQDTLVSGTNIKTINSQSILGSGDLTISGVSDEQSQEIAKIPTIETELAQKANVSDIPTVQNGRNGTNKNYVYSNADSSKWNDKVVSDCYFDKVSPTKLYLGIIYWGDEGTRITPTVPLATPSTAGIMSGYDKTKLDSIPETIPSQTEIDGIAANVSALETAMDGKQPTLVSGTNIKTINGNSILGEGNLVIEGGGVDLSNYYNKTEVDTKLDAKQNTLVSGTNIKTINSQSILGEGNLEISGGISEEQAQEIAKIPTLETELAQKANVSDVPTVQTSGAGTNKNYVYSDSNTTNTKVISNVTLVRKFDSIRMQKYYWIPDDSTSSNYVTDILPSATTTEAGVMSAADKTKLDSISNEWTGTQSEFDALTTKEDNIIYYVTE